MATTVSHPIPTAQAHAIADLTGYEDAATVGKRKARYPCGYVSSRSPGSRAGLLPPSPLRTTRASFPACRSSLANALLRTRFHHGQSLAMDLGMAVRMKQHTVF